MPTLLELTNTVAEQQRRIDGLENLVDSLHRDLARLIEEEITPMPLVPFPKVLRDLGLEPPEKPGGRTRFVIRTGLEGYR